MRKFIVICFLFLSLPVSLITFAANDRPTTPPLVQDRSTPPQLSLHRGTFDARTMQRQNNIWETAVSDYSIIQFHGPITLEDRQALQKTGVTLLEYLPDFAYLVRGTAAQQEQATQLDTVYAQIPFTIADKLSPALLRAIESGQTNLGKVQIFGWNGENGRLATALQANQFRSPMMVTMATLPTIASLDAVRWIEPVSQPRLLNDYARNIMAVNPVWQDRPLFGQGQIIAIADSGLDTGDFNTLSPDFTGRISATFTLSPTGHWDDNNGHGTHVAGSVASAGVRSGADPAQHEYATSFAGVAPEASLIIQAFEATPEGAVLGLDPDYYLLFEQAYNAGARLHSDSWGDLTGPANDAEAAFGGYPYGAQRTDQFIWEHPDMAIFFAAGNSGKDGTPDDLFGFCTGGDGVVDPDSLVSPGTAKNVITVGASESDRNTGGASGIPWLLLDFCFSVDPLNLDTVSDNADGMAAFSSRGPTDDGRIKPDIVTPGTNIVSNRSYGNGASALWGLHEINADYTYSGGTSMATPLTAGMAALIRQWLIEQGHSNPSAALIKALLLNTTQNMAPGQFGVGPTQEIPNTLPNMVTGWGRTNLGFITAGFPHGIWLDDHQTGLNTGDKISYTHAYSQPLTVLTDTMPLRIMLAWTDPPASLSAAKQLVNDLDLVVVGPGNTLYYGNQVNGGDRLNNVEGIIIENPPPGEYHIEIEAFNVPTMTQPYGLVVSGPLVQAVVTPTLSISHTGGTQIDLSWPNQSANCQYALHHSINANFILTAATILDPPGLLPGAITAHTIADAAGNTAVSHYYQLQAWNCGPDTAVSNRVGEFDFMIRP